MINPIRPLILTRRQFLTRLATTGVALSILSLVESCQVESADNASVLATPIVKPATIEVSTPSVVPSGDLSVGLDGLPFDSFMEEAYKRLMLRDPEAVTQSGLDQRYHTANDQLTNYSDEYIRETQKFQVRFLAQLRKYDYSTLSPDQVISAQAVDWLLDDMVRGHPFMYYDYPVSFYITSITFNQLGLFMEAQPMTTLQDAQAYVSRLEQVKNKFEQVLDGLKRREAAGVVLPMRLVYPTIDDLKSIAEAVPRQTPYFTTFNTKI